MLSLGLTGGIAAGKSLLANRFRELGAVVIDADILAREVVAPGTPGLAAVVGQFGALILLPDGSLDRAQLGAIVFADKDARESLNAIVHPLVRAAANALKDDAGPGSIVVQDIPLLVESGQGANFHLVIVAQAPKDVRVARMVRDRGMTEADALARIAAQATDEERAAVADVLIINDGTPDKVIKELDDLWHDRLIPFAANLSAGVPACASKDARAAQPDDSWPAQAARLAARIKHAVGELAAIIDIEDSGGDWTFRLQPAQGARREQIDAALVTAGFFLRQNGGQGSPRFSSADPGVSASVVIVV